MRMLASFRRVRSVALGGLLAMAAPLALHAQATPPPLAVYGQLPQVEMAALSPSGQRIAVVGWAGGKRVLTLSDAAMKPLRSVALGATKVRYVEWAGDGFVLVHYSSTVGLNAWFTTDKAEMGSVVVVPVEGAAPWPVFAHTPDINGGVAATYGVAVRDGRTYGEFGATTAKAPDGIVDGGMPVISTDLYEVDLATQRASVAAKQPGIEGRDRDWLLDAQGGVGAMLDVVHTSGQWTIRHRHRSRADRTGRPAGL